MNILPMKGITNFMNNANFSYVHSVLQSLSCLDFAKQFLSSYNFNFFGNNLYVTKELYALMNNLNNGNDAFSQDIINYYQNRVNMLFNNISIAFNTDPYHFLFYFLDILHYENNRMNGFFDPKTLYNQPLMSQQNDDYMYYLFMMFFNQTQNSMISNYFFNAEKHTTNCTNCGTIYFYAIKKILRFDVNKFKIYRDNAYPLKKFSNLNLDECFRCYIGGTSCRCQNCGNKAIKYSKICSSTKILIIYLDRQNNHSFKGDIDFPFQFNLINYYSIRRANNLNFNPIYNLRACISYDNFIGKYFADCLVKNNFYQNGIWCRFIDNQVRILNNYQNEIRQYEPQILIYELDNNMAYNMASNINMPNMNMNNQQQFNMNQQFNNNMPMNNNQQFNNFQNQFSNPLFNMFLMMMPKFQNMFNNNININNFNNNNFNNINNNNNNQNQDITEFQNQNLKMMNQINELNLNNDNTCVISQTIYPNNNPLNKAVPFGLKFILVPEIGDQSETPSNKIIPQVLSTYKFKEAVKNFFTKLVKPEEAIKKFLFNGNEISRDCEDTLEKLNMNQDTVIKAIKSPNFDQLKLV